MAEKRSKIGTLKKKQLISEAGGKCANPGCSAWRVHIHHIKQWSVYKTHDNKHMIAVCPNCHDQIHNGSIRFSDEELYKWKEFSRTSDYVRGHIYVEPNDKHKIIFGSVSFTTTNNSVVLFDSKNGGHLGYRVLDEDTVLVNARLLDSNGRELIRVHENNIKHRVSDGLSLIVAPGRVVLKSTALYNYASRRLVSFAEKTYPDFFKTVPLDLLDIAVLAPGVLKVRCIFGDPEFLFISTDTELSCFLPDGAPPFILMGDGEGTVINYLGPINETVLGIRPP